MIVENNVQKLVQCRESPEKEGICRWGTGALTGLGEVMVFTGIGDVGTGTVGGLASSVSLYVDPVCEIPRSIGPAHHLRRD